ncbi:hypothetical protein FS837_002918, partial [Tulasnella sp. UAMH 9824]
MLLDLVGLNFITPVLSGGSTWRLHRKLLRPALTVTTIREEYSDLLLTDALRYLKAVARSPRNFDASLKRIIGELITKLTFGACADSEGNDYVAKHETLLDYSKRAAAGYLVDFFPIPGFRSLNSSEMPKFGDPFSKKYDRKCLRESNNECLQMKVTRATLQIRLKSSRGRKYKAARTFIGTCRRLSTVDSPSIK